MSAVEIPVQEVDLSAEVELKKMEVESAETRVPLLKHLIAYHQQNIFNEHQKRVKYISELEGIKDTELSEKGKEAKMASLACCEEFKVKVIRIEEEIIREYEQELENLENMILKQF